MIPQRPLGRTGLTVSVLGFGGAPIGFADAPDAYETFVPLPRRALDLGITFFDTAPDYRRGEELLGRALRGRRSEVVLASKVGRVQTPSGGGWAAREDWTEAGVLAQVERSLRALETDYLDLVQLHSPPARVLDDGAALCGLQRAREAGMTRHIGVSADGPEAWRALELGPFATLQVSYSILQQEPGADLLARAAARGIGIIVKQPLANAVPALRERPTHPDWSWKWDVARQIDWAPADTPSERLGLALRWLLANPLVSTAIVGTTRVDHLDANVAATLAGPLDAATVRRFRDAYGAARKRLGPGRANG